jgi:hypothetical protein
MRQFCLKPAISISPYPCRLKIREWLREKHLQWSATSHMKKLKFLIKGPLDKLSRNLTGWIENRAC